MNRKPVNSAKGFTLIEVLVAITLMAVMAVMGWRGLDSITRSREQLDRSLASTRGLQAAFSQMQLDASQVLLPVQLGERPTLWSDGSSLSMLRRVSDSEQATRMLRVTYRVENGELLRETEPTENTIAQASKQTRRVVRLVPGIETLTIRLWMNDGRGWRPPGVWTDPSKARVQAQPHGVVIDIMMRGQNRPMTRKLLVGAL